MSNLEKYTLECESELTINFGKFTNIVFNKHVNKYGQDNAKKTRENVRLMYLCAMNQLNDTTKNNNLLLVGKIQSGKTSNLEMFTAIAFDNGYNCVVIYGGYDNKLLDQTSKRFKKTFNIDDSNQSIDVPELFSTNDGNSVDALDEDVVNAILNSGKPLIFVSMKRPHALERINSIISTFSNKKLKTFIIDDEGDQASLNTEFKKNKESSTYIQIINMKKYLNDPLYLSVTATPQANVLLGQYSELKPDGLRLIEPGSGYTGAEFFHLLDNNIKLIDVKDVELLSLQNCPHSLFNAIKYFFIASAIMKKRGINSKGFNYSDMIIHTSRGNVNHRGIYGTINAYIEGFKDNIKTNNPDFSYQLKEINCVYNSDYFSNDVLDEYKFEDLIEDIKDIIINTHLILQDSKGKVTQEHEKYKYHKIFIGGDLLQRGLTFEFLVTTYFTRWPKKSGNMDTIVQRARWLGYRESYLDLCKIFTTEEIQKEYCGLAQSENNLWEQCYSIENGGINIEDIVIDADSTSLNPTRKNVASYKKIQFLEKWSNQKIGVFDVNLLKENNKKVDEMFSKLDFTDSSKGRSDGKISNKYAYVDYSFIRDLVNNLYCVFDFQPFNKKELLEVFKNKKIIIVKMFDLNGTYECRNRSFDKSTSKIFALQQGPDVADFKLQKYHGDSHVLVDEEAINIQVFRVRPKIENNENSSFDQYMFSIHMPESKRGFIKC
jgi:hypothetical protein